MYDITWYTQNAAVVLVFIEFLKQFGAHYLRANSTFVKTWYPIIIKTLALAFGLFIAFGAKSDLLVSIGVIGVHPYVGYALAGAGLAVGNVALDMVWDNKRLIKAFFDAYLAARQGAIAPSNAPNMETASHG